MPNINGVDFDKVTQDALAAAKQVLNDDNVWGNLKDIVKNISDGLVADVEFIVKKKASGEFNETDAKIYLEDQKTIARVRIRSVAIITLQIGERVLNAISEVFNKAINTALGWSLL
jgi:hypothetical protein